MIITLHRKFQCYNVRISTQRYTGDKAGAESVKAQVRSTGQGIREGGKVAHRLESAIREDCTDGASAGLCTSMHKRDNCEGQKGVCSACVCVCVCAHPARREYKGVVRDVYTDKGELLPHHAQKPREEVRTSRSTHVPDDFSPSLRRCAALLVPPRHLRAASTEETSSRRRRSIYFYPGRWGHVCR